MYLLLVLSLSELSLHMQHLYVSRKDGSLASRLLVFMTLRCCVWRRKLLICLIFPSNGAAIARLVWRFLPVDHHGASKITDEFIHQPTAPPSLADIVFVIKTKPHARFKREDQNLVCTVIITLEQALTGTARFFQGLDVFLGGEPSFFIFFSLCEKKVFFQVLHMLVRVLRFRSVRPLSNQAYRLLSTAQLQHVAYIFISCVCLLSSLIRVRDSGRHARREKGGGEGAPYLDLLA